MELLLELQQMDNLLHYGENKYQPSKVKPIENEKWVKPKDCESVLIMNRECCYEV